MKTGMKITSAVFAAALAGAIAAPAAFAAGGNGSGYVDTNGDGICDYYGTVVGTDGIVGSWMHGNRCANLFSGGQGNGYGGYVDENGDGICDNNGSGNYVDTDGDGVCDNIGTGFGNGAANGNGNGNGYRGGR